MKLKDFFDKPEKWTKGASARNALGSPAPITLESAVCWCLTGAILKLWPEASQKQIRFEKHALIMDAALILNYWIPGRDSTIDSVIALNDQDAITFEDIKIILEQADV